MGQFLSQFLFLTLLFLTLASCSEHLVLPQRYTAVGVAIPPVSMSGNSTSKAGPTTADTGGTLALGVTVPTADSVAARIENGLEKNATRTSGHFADLLSQVQTNLPKVTNVNSASGYDQIELLTFAACADLTEGSPSTMESVYGIQPGNSIASNQSALIAAGLRILDQHTAGLASQGPGAAQVTTVLTNLVQAEAGVGSNTSTMAFMAVCIAASTAGAALLGI
ncbi:MAG: hypothetical protein C5B49_08800 [Bdellovibrio sp.]|nr:MAG: hypothetical protein C5B49_08800 [Bdellovibrio sp.]